ncbi:MAG: hemerythrin domain-containing protein [Betaproteobacteria bacterium]|nr:hemerythrin domain-containing protein [Betaproteobacteria bacterium]MDH4326746.1 hemerythrin domain-containing protein [Betaproteobacteria bacterium]MDH5579368.1 hemerythrin domain-containing protein [Betaproteobacteria bacterium]
MAFDRAISQQLHEEHAATLALWGRVEQSLAAGAPAAALMREAAAALANEIERHFEFEETQLFPRLAAAGEGDIAALLIEEHAAIRAAGARFMQLALEDPPRAELRPLAFELAERLVSHVQKEEMALLPALDDLLDEQADRELQLVYAS